MEDKTIKDTDQNNELAAKREEAKRAMSSMLNNSTAETPAPQSIQNAPIRDYGLEEALSGIGKMAPSAEDTLATAEKRLQAQIAMEGEERRKRREEAIRKEREEAEKKRLEEEKSRREQYEREKLEQERIDQERRQKEQRERISAELKQQVETIKGSAEGLKTIRTLKHDQDNLIKGQNLSIVGIAIKEEERRRREEENRSITSSTNRWLLLSSLVLIILGSGTAFYIYDQYYREVPIGILPGTNVTPESILFADTHRSLDTTGITTDDLLTRIRNEVRNPPDLRLGAVENFVLNKKNEAGANIPLTAYELFKSIASEAPENLLRSLEDKYMFGILSSAENAAFIILKTESYDISRAGLLEWERGTFAKDLYQVLTSLRPDTSLLTKDFEDLLIRNIDTRVLKDQSGEIRIVYGFLDSVSTIAIAGSRQAFIEAHNRFVTPRPLSR